MSMKKMHQRVIASILTLLICLVSFAVSIEPAVADDNTCVAVAPSAWSTTRPTGIDESRIESRYEYRYMDLEQVFDSETPNMQGVTLRSSRWQQTSAGLIQYVSSWPSGFSKSHSLYSRYSGSPKQASETATKKVTIVSTSTAGYIYWHWCNNYLYGPLNRLIEIYYTSKYHTFHAFYSTTNAGNRDPNGVNGGNAAYYHNASACKDSYWWMKLPVSQQSYQEFKKIFTYERWGSWSGWSTTYPSSKSDRKIESRVVYRDKGVSYSSHSWNSGVITINPTCTENGQRKYTCTRCNATKTEVINKLDHKYGSWQYVNATQHRKVCQNDSSHTEYSYHIWGAGKITKQPTETSEGVITYTCTECKGQKTEAIAPIEHTHILVKTNAKAATCTQAGNKDYWKCTGCGKVYSDSNGTKETTVAQMTIAKLGHNYGSWQYANDYNHERVCSNDHTHVITDTHSWDKGVVTKQPTETTTGTRKYTCGVCKGTKIESISPLKHTHVLTKTAAKAATCTASGNKAYWTCTGCNMVFSDSNGKNAVTVASMTVVAKGHNYGAWTKYSAQRHKRVCENDSSHIEYQNHTWDTGTVTKVATALAEGVKTYTCTACKANKTETIPKVKAKTTLRRLYGDNRYDTSIAIADAYKKDSKQDKYSSIIVACGNNFPDALSASCLANKLNAPVLVWRDKENTKIQSYIKKNVKPGGRVYLLGGTAVVSNIIKSGLSGYKFTRLEGKTRFETNIEVLKKVGKRSGKMLVCDGLTFENALIASATGEPILLVNPGSNSLRPAQIEYLKSLGNMEFIIIGTEKSVPKSIAVELAYYGTVSRIVGRTTDQISYNVAKQLYGPKPKEVTLAIDKDYPDGLCGGIICIANAGPLFLINKDSYKDTLNYCRGLSFSRINVLGGPTLISDNLAKEIGQIS